MPRRRHPKAPQSLLTFPARMTLRIMGHTQPGFLDRVEAVLRIHLPELPASAVAVHPSRGGKYLSVTAQVTLDSKPQLDALYKALRQVDGVISVF